VTDFGDTSKTASAQRDRAIEAVLGVFLQQQATGDAVSFDALVEAHSDLMPELGDRCRELQAFREARGTDAIEPEVREGVSPQTSSTSSESATPTQTGSWLTALLLITTVLGTGSAVWQWRRAELQRTATEEQRSRVVALQESAAETRDQVEETRKFTKALIKEIAPIYGRRFAGAPYADLRWDRDTPHVEFDGTWYELVAINDVASAELVTYCRATFGDGWRRRFALDLPVVLLGVQQPAASTVALKLRDPANGRVLVVDDAKMSKANRATIQDAGTGTLERVAAFGDMRPAGGDIEVTMSGERFTLVAMNGSPIDDIIRFAKDRHGKWWLKVLAENLSDLLEDTKIGQGSWLSLQALGPDSTESVDLDHVLMTRANWERLALTRPLSQSEARDICRELTKALQTRHAYFPLGRERYLSAVAGVESRLGEMVDQTEFTLNLSQLITLAGDSHTRLRLPRWEPLSEQFAPFLVGQHEERFFAFQPDRSAFIDDEHPFVTSIDGVPIKDWIETAKQLGVQGSPQNIRKTSRRNLRYVPLLRRQLGIDASDDVTLRLESADGGSKTKTTMSLSMRKPIFGAWPPTKSRVLEGELGYLRIDNMDSERKSLRELVKQMFEFRSTRGLIFDVRGNGGGTRHMLRTLLPFFMSPEEPPRIVNVAKYRLREDEPPDKPGGYLDKRFLFPVACSVWSEAERTAVRQFAESFEPEWQPPSDGFSEWHYFVISRPRANEVDWYDRPVVVLMDSGCASATDIFLGAFKGLPNVTLLGTPSAGMSGRTRTVELSPGFEASISTMCSFQPNGQLYNQGIAPDRALEPIPTDWIGESDSLLDAAVELLEKDVHLTSAGDGTAAGSNPGGRLH